MSESSLPHPFIIAAAAGKLESILTSFRANPAAFAAAMFESVDIEEPNDSEIRLGENNRRKMFQEKKKFTMSKEDLLQP